jgi:predicted Holliday junction resolvase-like endonuclease
MVLCWIAGMIYLTFKNGKYSKLYSQKKKSEVRLGFIAETLSPFLKDFDKDPKKLSFLGNPIDFVYFGEDEIVFIEVKSGKSQLNKNQSTVRDLVKNKKVSFEIFRVE